MTQYHVLYIREGQPSYYEAFPDRTTFVNWYKELRPQTGQLFVFRGERLLLTRGPWPYVFDEDDYHPLFDAPAPGPFVLGGALDDDELPGHEYAQLTPDKLA